MPAVMIPRRRNFKSKRAELLHPLKGQKVKFQCFREQTSARRVVVHSLQKAPFMGIIWTIIIGFVAGVIAKFVIPGENEPSGFVLTTLLGILGAFVASYLGQSMGWYGQGGRTDRGRRGSDYHSGGVRHAASARLTILEKYHVTSFTFVTRTSWFGCRCRLPKPRADRGNAVK
jgi:uncharacterized membrane protein YeaQ/YmgE (transglycosylase-associated protein family)